MEVGVQCSGVLCVLPVYKKQEPQFCLIMKWIGAAITDVVDLTEL